MDRATKQAQIESLKDKFGRSAALYVADYKGMNVEQVTTMRKTLASLGGVEMRVVKNNLARKALENESYGSLLDDVLIGTNAIIFSYNDPVVPAKALVKFAEEFEHLKLKTGVLNGQLLSEAQVKAISELPSREQLIAKLMGSLNAPAQNLAGVFAAIPRQVLNVLNAIKQKKESEVKA